MASQHGLAARVVEMQGGHHFGGDYEKLAAIILEHYKQYKLQFKGSPLQFAAGYNDSWRCSAAQFRNQEVHLCKSLGRMKMDVLTITGAAVVTVLSITSHEAAHGFVANRLGDSTAREQGRLTLNPIPHIDLFFTILLPLFLILSGSGFIFGGAKPVPVNVSRLHSPRRDWALVGVAGPAMNLAIALALTVILSAATGFGLTNADSSLARILAIGIFLNLLLAVFNLIPIPPLDGSRLVQYFLSGEALIFYRRIEQFGLLIILGLLFLVPGASALLAVIVFRLVELITLPFGVWTDVEPLLQSTLSG